MELYDKTKALNKRSLGKLNKKSNISTHDKLLGKKESLSIKKTIFDNEEKTYNKYKIPVNHR